MKKNLGKWIEKHGIKAVAIILVIIAVPVIAHIPSVVKELYEEKPGLQNILTLLITSANMESIDDQSGILWPLLVTLVITMLGSLITTYIFLKEALDRMADEHPCQKMAIDAYREKTICHLWKYLLFSFAVMGVTIVLYLDIYYAQTRMRGWLRLSLAMAYIACMVYSAYILWQCIKVDQGVQNEIEILLEERQTEADEKKKELQKLICEVENYIDPGTKKTIEFLQIGAACASKCVDTKKFIDTFSDWEKMLKSLSSEGKEHLKTAIINAEKGFTLNSDEKENDVEWKDAKSQKWDQGAFSKIENIWDYLNDDLTSEGFFSIFALLSEYRDLLQAKMELSIRKQSREPDYIKKEKSDTIVQLLLLFYLYLASRGFRILPKIEEHLPAKSFPYANFYSSRIENASFRASVFQDGIFSRSKISNSNFSLTSFKGSDFFGTDSRNCSYSNSEFLKCNFKESIFDNVDLTGSILQGCTVQSTKFTNSILDNVELRIERNGIELKGNNFSESKIQDFQVFVGFAVKKAASLMADLDITDPIINVYCSLIDRTDVTTYFLPNWRGGEEPPENLLRIQTLVKMFTIENFKRQKFFSKIGKEGLRSRIQSHLFWEKLRIQAVIYMDENVFVNASMPRIKFYRTSLKESVFSIAQMDSAELIGLYMPGCVMDRVNLRGSTLFGVHMKSSVLDDAILYNAVCKLVDFEDASMRILHASGAEFQYCLFERSDCTKIDFTRAKLEDCSFRDTLLYQGEFTETTLKNCSLEGVVANEILASYTIFEKCTVKNGLLHKGGFNCTVFLECDFTQASFTGSVFTDCTFIRCNFKDSGFQDVCFVSSQFKESKHPYFLRGCTFIQTKVPYLN